MAASVQSHYICHQCPGQSSVNHFNLSKDSAFAVPEFNQFWHAYMGYWNSKTVKCGPIGEVKNSAGDIIRWELTVSYQHRNYTDASDGIRNMYNSVYDNSLLREIDFKKFTFSLSILFNTLGSVREGSINFTRINHPALSSKLAARVDQQVEPFKDDGAIRTTIV